MNNVSVLKICTFGLACLLVACGGEEVAKGPSEGEKLVKANCLVCHGSGINGAPIIGNAKMWGERLTQGKDVLTQHAINGYGLMPAKGGKTHLSDEQIGLAVAYMIEQAQQ